MSEQTAHLLEAFEALPEEEKKISVKVPFLKPGALLVQNVSTYPNVRAIRKLGALKLDQFGLVFAGLLRWLGKAEA
jgi:hypothetical protein